MSDWLAELFATVDSPGVVHPDGVSIVVNAQGRLCATGSSSTMSFADQETPAGTVNGANKVFTLAHAPNPPASLQLSDGDGLVLRAGVGNDYTLVGNTITFAVAPTAPPLAWYRY